MLSMDGDWARVGRAVKAARALQNLTQKQLGNEVGVSVGTIAAIERGQQFSKVTPTLRAVEGALGWASGSIEAIKAGGDPLPGERPAPLAEKPGEVISKAAGAPWRVVQALNQGTTLDGAVLPLGPNANMVILVQGDPGATPAELEEALLRWEDHEGHLRRLGEVADEPTDKGDK